MSAKSELHPHQIDSITPLHYATIHSEDPAVVQALDLADDEAPIGTFPKRTEGRFS